MSLRPRQSLADCLTGALSRRACRLLAGLHQQYLLLLLLLSLSTLVAERTTPQQRLQQPALLR
ncbi:hypothetical protein [Serratia sp. SSNIH4]|uniref:hypothetical protein n=1 Tax=Serratia sp. SSNIH4 TaxID=1920112 RepID=UPI0011AF196A|nr:hypothetical protein [Serratia sp. SSNIH4]